MSFRVLLRCLLKCVREIPLAVVHRVMGGERDEVWNEGDLSERIVVVAEAIAIVVFASREEGESERVSL